MTFTIDQILSFAPDDGTAQRGKTLAVIRKWENLKASDRAVWADCVGSSRAYKTMIDLNGPAFKCSCPSRKFPCKHSIGLLILYSDKQDSFVSSTQLPKAVQTWLDSRNARAEKSASKAAPRSAEQVEKSEAGKAKNLDKRMLQMETGMEDLETWLHDMIRQGIAAVDNKDVEFYDNIAARMVDAKLSGIRKKILALAHLPYSGVNWPERYLSQLAEIYMLMKGFKKLEQLPENLQEELMSIAGYNAKKDDLLAQAGIADDWMVLGLVEGEEERLTFRRTWLKGIETGRIALILDFVFGNAGFTTHFVTGTSFKGELVFYPSTFPVRALLKNQENIRQPITDFYGVKNVEEFLEQYSTAISSNPWLLNFPVALNAVIPIQQEMSLLLVDQQKKCIPCSLDEDQKWKLLAISGNQAIDIFGEWSGHSFVPVSVFAEGRFVLL